jgi:hypothetical protein
MERISGLPAYVVESTKDSIKLSKKPDFLLIFVEQKLKENEKQF